MVLKRDYKIAIGDYLFSAGCCHVGDRHSAA